MHHQRHDVLAAVPGTCRQIHSFHYGPAPEHGKIYIQASLHADELRDATGFAMPDGEYETLAGFILDQLGAIPDRPEGNPGPFKPFEIEEMAAVLGPVCPHPREMLF